MVSKYPLGQHPLGFMWNFDPKDGGFNVLGQHPLGFKPKIPKRSDPKDGDPKDVDVWYSTVPTVPLLYQSVRLKIIIWIWQNWSKIKDSLKNLFMLIYFKFFHIKESKKIYLQDYKYFCDLPQKLTDYNCLFLLFKL